MKSYLSRIDNKITLVKHRICRGKRSTAFRESLRAGTWQ